MRPDYTPRKQQLVITAQGGQYTQQFTWRDVAHECYAEMSAEGRVEVDNMTTVLLAKLKRRHTGHNALGLSEEGVRELLCALIGGGWW